LILDTNALSAVADADPRIKSSWSGARKIAIPVIVLGEYRYGISQSRKRVEYQSWLETHLPLCDVLGITDETTAHYAEIRLELKQTGTPIPSNDLWIAALCRQHRMPLLSRDRHFDVVNGIRRIDW
jgi:tRNA(fMet)-specific endonuclease VapC